MSNCSKQTGKAGLKVRPACLLIVIALFASAASAQKKEAHVINSILGVGIGSTFEETRSKLSSLGSGGGRDTRDGGRKEAWTLKGTEYATIAFKTNGKRRVAWISAFARPGKEVPFAKLGDLSQAVTSDSEAVWNVKTATGGYRLVAKGAHGRASVVYLLSLEFPAIQ